MFILSATAWLKLYNLRHCYLGIGVPFSWILGVILLDCLQLSEIVHVWRYCVGCAWYLLIVHVQRGRDVLVHETCLLCGWSLLLSDLDFARRLAVPTPLWRWTGFNQLLVQTTILWRLPGLGCHPVDPERWLLFFRLLLRVIRRVR